MPGVYFNPIQRIFLNLSGGTVTGNTTFTQGLYGESLTGGTIYSGGTELSLIMAYFASSANFLPLTGGTGGPYFFTGNTTGQTMYVSNNLFTPLMTLSSLTVSENNIILTGDTLNGGSW
jgi:hypothetical protein